jgi:hypothetical protein
MVSDCRMANDAAMKSSTKPAHVYEVRPRKDHRGVDLISDVLPFGRSWYGEPDATADYSEAMYAALTSISQATQVSSCQQMKSSTRSLLLQL